MKNVIGIILGLIFIFNLTSAQTFAPVGAEWTYKTWGSSGGEISKVTVIRDTLINKKYCTIIHRSLQGEKITTSELILHQENDRIYFYEDGFKLLYNFSKSLAIGDTVFYYVPNNIQAYDFSCSGQDSIQSTPYTFIVLSIDSVSTLGGKYLKVWKTYLPNSPFFHSIVENIGDEGGFIGDNCELLGGVPSRLLCYNNGEIDYLSSIADDCLGTSIENISSEEMQISPNPTKKEIIIKNNNGHKIRKWSLINQQGISLATQTTIPSKEILIDLENFQNGVYFLQIMVNNGTIITKKVYKN